MNSRERIRSLIDSTSSPGARTFDIAIQALIFCSIIAFAVETLPNLSKSTRKFLYFFEIFSVLIFTGEYLLRIYAAKKPMRFIFSFFGCIDLIAILPFYLSFGLDLRSIRVFRAFRLFRSLKLVRYNMALRRFYLAITIAKEEIVLFLIATLMLLYLASVGIYFFENEAQPEKFASIFDSLWWAVATMTTVGYGDIYPITVGGKIFTFFILLVGLGIVTVPAGLVASALSKARGMQESNASNPEE